MGGVHDEATNRFDHHQEGGAGVRSSGTSQGIPKGIPYASCGLVWKKFGAQVAGSEEVAARIDQEIIAPIDASDNGFDIAKGLVEGVEPYLLQRFISVHNPTWKETYEHADEMFVKMVAFARDLLVREISVTRELLEGEAFVKKAYEAAPDKQLIVLDEDYPWVSIITQFPEPLYVVYPSSARDMWRIKAVRKNPASYENRKSLPAAWAGKTGKELQDITGVPDAVFCHNKRFTGAARSKEGALALADLALKN